MKNKAHLYLILTMLFVVLIGGLFAFALINPFKAREESATNLLRTETIYIIMFLLVALLGAIWMFIVNYYKKRKDPIENWRVIGEVSPSQEETKPDPEEQEEQEEKSRFQKLSETDENKDKLNKKKFEEKASLYEICETFRNFSASRLKLYYSIDDIRRFIAGLSVSHILIMQGMSGTGKTSLAVAFGEFLSNKSTVVPIQPMWKERTDMVGYYNEFTRKFNETTLLQKMYEANYSDDIYVTVLDEMNIARVEYYFAEFLSLLELPNPDSRNIDVVSDTWKNDPKLLKGGRLKLPENMWFIGTANNDDSTFAISDKVYDRAMIMNLEKKTTVFVPEDVDGMNISYKYFESLVKKARKRYGITDRNLRRIRELDEYMVENFHITFGNRIMKQIKQYVATYIACGGSELEAIDDIISKKIMRKLETQNPVYIRNSIDGLCNRIDEIFSDGMVLTKEYLRRLERTI